MSKRTSTDQSSLSSWVIKRPNVFSVFTTITKRQNFLNPNAVGHNYYSKNVEIKYYRDQNYRY